VPTSPTPELQSRIAAAKTAVRGESELLHRHFGAVESNWKRDGSRVTAVDLAISENIFRVLAATFPEDQFLSEELTDSGQPIPVTARFSWILDPIDGTNNYAAGIAHCAIALALLEHGRPVYGVIYDLSRRTLIHGGPGLGVFDGDRVAHVKQEAPGEPGAGARVAVRQHDAAGLGLHGELQQLVALGVAAELEALDAGLDLGLHVGRRR
jgi:myo-inositol-1(or 4)-monophosphatase